MTNQTRNGDNFDEDALYDGLSDGRQSETAMRIMRGVARMLAGQNFASLPELTLPNYRRADLLAVGPRGEIWIIEIKSSLTDFQTDKKWPEYLDYCDSFFFAVEPAFPVDRLPEACGLILADAYGGEIVRPAPVAKLPAARRTVITRRVARVGANRLRHLSDPRRPSSPQRPD
jgi:hypothetical protein